MDDLRNATKQFMAKYGCPMTFIAKKLGVTSSHLHHCIIKGDRELGKKRQAILREIVYQNQGL